MTRFETIQTAYFIISVLILVATVYYIYYGPIKAVKIGRKLSEEQNKYDAKMRLFLMLFSYRGDPINYNFVNGLNQIEVVFQDTQTVLTAWRKLYEALNRKDDMDSWPLLRVELLSAMAVSLGYNGLQQTDIQRHYIPVGHHDFLQNDSALREAAMKYFQKGSEMYDALIENSKNNIQQTGQNN